MMIRKRIAVLSIISILVAACGGGSGGTAPSIGNSNSGGSGSTVINDPITLSGVSIDVSGKATYDNVPHTASSGLDYNNITSDPIAGAVVEALINGNVVASTSTDSLGNYQLTAVPTQGRRVIVRVKAQLLKVAAASGEPAWNMRVVDNTKSQALYALDSAATSTASSNVVIDLHAASGWGGASYTTTRAAAPFHILARANDMIQKLVAVDTDIQMPALLINWSVNNVAVNGDLAVGQIGTSFYSGQLYILGAANSDTDEYDGHVIIHELGHYFEDKLSRSDSIGGSHSGSQSLDMRLAFGEGFGNAWSGMITDDSFYRDSFGASQASGFAINVEANPVVNPGWFNESTVQSVLYDVYDSTNDGADTTSLGLAPIYNVLVGAQKNTPAFTSIFSFITHLKAENAGGSAGINAIAGGQSMVAATMDIYGSTEANNAANALSLPVYLNLVSGVESAQVCSINDFDNGDGNKLAIFRYVRFNIATAGSYTLTATPKGANAATVNIDFDIIKNGVTLVTARTLGNGVNEINTRNYVAGDYVASFYEFGNISTQKASQDSCFTVTLTQN